MGAFSNLAISIMIVWKCAEDDGVGKDDRGGMVVEPMRLSSEEGGETSRVADDDAGKHGGGDGFAPERVDLA